MKALIRNCSHESEIYLVEELGKAGDPEAIYKSSSFENGIRNLRNELEGVQWYNQQVDHPIAISVAQETENYLAIKFGFLQGTKALYKEGYFKNRERIELIVEHYCKVWGEAQSSGDGFYPLHGDLSLDNVLFCGKIPIFLDWEHFSHGVAPLGFDALYLLFESLWFESKNGKPGSQSISHLSGMIQILREKKCLDEKFCKNPLVEVVKFIKSHLSLWGDQLSKFEGKLPVLFFTEESVKCIDDLLGQ